MRHFYAHYNPRGFSNTGEVLVFDSASARDDWVDLHQSSLPRRRATAIKRHEVTAMATNYSLSQNCTNAPRPFTCEAWVICDDHDADWLDIPGFVGVIGVKPTDHWMPDYITRFHGINYYRTATGGLK